MPRAFNTPRCRNLGFSLNRARRSYLRSFGCPYFSWGASMRDRWFDRKIAAAKAKGAVAIFRQSGGQIAEVLHRDSAA